MCIQDILNKNKLLISQIQHNHEIRTPDSLQHNAVLIRELNNNIGQIVKAYHELSVQEDFVRSQPQWLARSLAGKNLVFDVF
jgi:hypothetical protein